MEWGWTRDRTVQCWYQKFLNSGMNLKDQECKNACSIKQITTRTLPHLPYSLDLSPTNNHLFKHLDNFSNFKTFCSKGKVEPAFKHFFEVSRTDRYNRWQNYIDVQGSYVNWFKHFLNSLIREQNFILKIEHYFPKNHKKDLFSNSGFLHQFIHI